LVFKKNANYFAENWGKSQKIVIITSTPGHPAGNCNIQNSGDHFLAKGLAIFMKSNVVIIFVRVSKSPKIIFSRKYFHNRNIDPREME
jgi:hypothetical protein